MDRVPSIQVDEFTGIEYTVYEDRFVPRNGSDGEVRPRLLRRSNHLFGATKVSVRDADLANRCTNQRGNCGAGRSTRAKDQCRPRHAAAIEQRIE